MTLVVSEISKEGIVIIGDSAVTYKYSDGSMDVEAGAVKAQYISKINAGISMWGHGEVGGLSLDKWIKDFIETQTMNDDTIESFGLRLVSVLNRLHQKEIDNGNTWEKLRSGFHLAGYIEGKPHLFHVHNGHDHEKKHELRLYRDYPNDQLWSPQEFEKVLDKGVHLRNGYTLHFAYLFDSMLAYSSMIGQKIQITIPQKTLYGRFTYLKELVKFVAGILDSAGVHKGVNRTLSAIAFDQNGLMFDEQLDFQNGHYSDADLSKPTFRYY